MGTQFVAMNFCKLANNYMDTERIFYQVVHFELAGKGKQSEKSFDFHSLKYDRKRMVVHLQLLHCIDCILLHAVPFSMLCQSLPGIHDKLPLVRHQHRELDMVVEDHQDLLLMLYVAKQLKYLIFFLLFWIKAKIFQINSIWIILHCTCTY